MTKFSVIMSVDFGRVNRAISVIKLLSTLRFMTQDKVVLITDDYDLYSSVAHHQEVEFKDAGTGIYIKNTPDEILIYIKPIEGE